MIRTHLLESAELSVQRVGKVFMKTNTDIASRHQIFHQYFVAMING